MNAIFFKMTVKIKIIKLHLSNNALKASTSMKASTIKTTF